MTLALGRFSVGDPAEYAIDGCPADECFGVFWPAFVVAGQPAVCGEPSEGSFHNPTARVNGEAPLLGGLSHDLNGGLQRVAGPVDEPASEALISEDMSDRTGQIPAQQTKYKIALTISRRECFSGRPSPLGSGKSSLTSSHWASVRSDGYPRRDDTGPPCPPGPQLSSRHTIYGELLKHALSHSRLGFSTPAMAAGQASWRREWLARCLLNVALK